VPSVLRREQLGVELVIVRQFARRELLVHLVLELLSPLHTADALQRRRSAARRRDQETQYC